jgi:hypothetical protein
MREALSLLNSTAGTQNQTVQIEYLRAAEEDNPEPAQSSTTMPTQDRPPAAEEPQQRWKHLNLAVAFFGISIAAAGALTLWSWRESVPLPPMPRIAQEEFWKQSAAPSAKNASPALPVAEPPPDQSQSPGGSERQPPTPKLAGLNGAVRDAVNSDSAIPPVVPWATDHATSTSRARWNGRVSRRPEHTSPHARAVRVAAAKKPIWRLQWQARAEDEWCIVACRRANGEWCFFGCRAWRAQPVFYNVTR